MPSAIRVIDDIGELAAAGFANGDFAVWDSTQGKFIPASDVARTGQTNTFTAAQTINGDLTVAANTLFVDSVSGNVGIGTTNPRAKLEVNGAILLPNNRWLMGRNSGDTWNGGLIKIGSDNKVHVTNSLDVIITEDVLGGVVVGALDPGTAKFAVMNGNVGIGTTNPTISGTGKLHMAGDTVRLDTARTIVTAGDAGNPGEICWDSNYLYVCVALNTWKRVALSSW